MRNTSPRRLAEPWKKGRAYQSPSGATPKEERPPGPKVAPPGTPGAECPSCHLYIRLTPTTGRLWAHDVEGYPPSPRKGRPACPAGDEGTPPPDLPDLEHPPDHLWTRQQITYALEVSHGAVGEWTARRYQPMPPAVATTRSGQTQLHDRDACLQWAAARDHMSMKTRVRAAEVLRLYEGGPT